VSGSGFYASAKEQRLWRSSLHGDSIQHHRYVLSLQTLTRFNGQAFSGIDVHHHQGAKAPSNPLTDRPQNPNSKPGSELWGETAPRAAPPLGADGCGAVVEPTLLRNTADTPSSD